MTTVSVERSEDGHITFAVTGHAGHGPPGADIVCAGASVLGYALLEALGREELAGRLRLLRTHDAPGNIRVTVAPRQGSEERIEGIVDTVLAGYALLANRYPEHVRIDGAGKPPFSYCYEHDAGE